MDVRDTRKAFIQKSACTGPDISLLTLIIHFFGLNNVNSLSFPQKKKCIQSLTDTATPKKGRERGPRGMVVLWNVKYLLRVKKKLVKQEVILRNF